MIHEARKLIKPPLFSILQSTQKKESSRHKRRVSCVYGALAAGNNVYLSIHDDKDFVTCATSIHMRTGYQLDDLPVVYFCFASTFNLCSFTSWGYFILQSKRTSRCFIEGQE